MSLLAESVSGYLENASWIRRMFEAGGQLKARYGAENVYDFSLGNPDLPAPAAVGEGLRRFAEHAGEPFAFGYMPNAGFPWAREQLAAHLSKEQGVALEANDVLLTCGAAGGLNAFLRAVINPGEKMLTFAPYFVEYGFYVANHGGSLQAIMSKPGTFEPDLDALEEAIDEKTRVVLINSPHNPTGVVYSRKAVTSLCRLLENKSEQYGHPIWLIADEPYRFLTYDGVEVPSVLPLYQYAVVISSFSKNLSLPGERVGYVAVSPKLADRAKLMAGLTLTNRILGFVNPPVVGQHIMAAALGSQVDVEIYARRRQATGYAFPPDGDWQRDFETRFDYDETDDQLNATAEIKQDMEKGWPMDRLLCGDVGVGKTEVALRAAFKCVMGGKQCAILAPTTLLAWQHYNSIISRMEAFPVKVGLLSRFRTAEGDPPGPAGGQCGHRGGHPPAAVQGREVP